MPCRRAPSAGGGQFRRQDGALPCEARKTAAPLRARRPDSRAYFSVSSSDRLTKLVIVIPVRHTSLLVFSQYLLTL